MVLIDPPKANEADNLLDYQRLARHLGISGAFNVNSTSVDAWKAILATLSGHEISYLSGQALDRDQVDSSRRVVKATAWCEATVQRIPEWVNPTDEPSTVKHADYPSQNPTDEPILRQWQPNPDLPVTNERFGRKFEIVSFRWLAPEEV